jgi:hypothetical protein
VDDNVVHTPVGPFDRSTTQWTIGAIETVQDTPTWAVVVGVLLIPCTGFLSLLLLLAKEPTGAVMIRVTVTDRGAQYATNVYAADHVAHVESMRAVNWARSGASIGGGQQAIGR